ncbi:ABC-F family ATP-binding cassette domain-containing protein [Deinococcus altitudinis]|uniref:ABC-F family ATP-binding cassette domain-containing protein n=1 Tax=Deinococcus altitudinis TaxID=468914 RepID=UPI003892736E
MQLKLEQVARVYGDRTVFSGVSLNLAPGERLALIGENGSGKTTLLRLMAGLESPDGGTVTLEGRAALLEQQDADLAGGLLEAVTPPELRAAQKALRRASAALSEEGEAALNAFASAEETYRHLGGYGFPARAAGVLSALGLLGSGLLGPGLPELESLPEPGLPAEARAAQLSGGQARRLMLARLLLSPADLYLLDEPTNHLDAEGVVWLETWIRESPAAFVLASHDRAFLDAVATRTAELERGHLSVYSGNYTAAMQEKAALWEAQERQYEAGRRQRSALEDEARRRQSKARSAGSYNPKRASDGDKLLAKGKAQNAQNVNSSRAKALERRLERLEVSDKPFDDRRTLHLDLPLAAPGPLEVLTLRDLTVQRGGQAVLRGVNLTLRRGERVALQGPNGGGKSSLLGAVLGRLSYHGHLQLGHGLSLAWAGQHGEELLGLDTLKDALLNANPALTPHQLYEVAAALGLPADPSTPVASLSGGQRTRLSLARLNVTRAQFLLLDEPTNHLDLRAIEALEAVLLAFPGTLLIASHDRQLVERVATRRLWVEGGRLSEPE